MESLRVPPIGFAHRGARAIKPENTIDAFETALRMGATGLESDVWLTADGVAVLDHDGLVRSGVRRRSIREVRRSALPSHIPALEELYERCGTEFELSLDVKDPDAAGPTVDIARAAGAVERLWLCTPDWERAAGWRRLHDDVRLVDSTRLRKVKEGLERRIADLADAGIDALNMHNTDWNAGLVTLTHRFGRLAFSWDCQFDRVILSQLAFGVDGVYSDFVDRLMPAIVEISR